MIPFLAPSSTVINLLRAMFLVPRTIRHVVFAALFAGVGFLGIDDVAHCVSGGDK
jgi:hypothetical protein